jgi:hypothetical protein
MSQSFLTPASNFCLFALRAGRPPCYSCHFLQKGAALARRVSSFSLGSRHRTCAGITLSETRREHQRWLLVPINLVWFGVAQPIDLMKTSSASNRV